MPEQISDTELRQWAEEEKLLAPDETISPTDWRAFYFLWAHAHGKLSLPITNPQEAT